MRHGFTLSLSLALITIAPALGQEAKIADGREIAMRVCAACHVVVDGQAVAPTLKPPAPSFAEIAARPDVTEAFLRDFLTKAAWAGADSKRHARLSHAKLSGRRGHRLSHEPEAAVAGATPAARRLS